MHWLVRFLINKRTHYIVFCAKSLQDAQMLAEKALLEMGTDSFIEEYKFLGKG